MGTSDIFEGGRKLPIMEEFYTLQGEGYNMGKAAYFIRLGGCDVGCSWCDTKESWNPALYPPMAIDECLKRAVASPGKTVVVTGGEPSRYPLDYFTKCLKDAGVTTMIETSGVAELTGDWDWICLSPKHNSHPKASIFRRAHELKVIIQREADLEWALENAARVTAECKLFLQPEWSRAEENMDMLTEFVMENPSWRISLQAHKYMRIP